VNVTPDTVTTDTVTPWPIVADRIAALAAVPGRLLVVTDFDGTIAPITPEPMATRVLPLGRAALRRLAGLAEARPDRLELVVLSGRAAADVAGRVRVGGVRYLGNHGVEGGSLARRSAAERLAVATDPDLVRHAPTVRRLAADVAGRLGNPDWLFVEDKGPTVAFHFRRAADGEAARSAVLAAIDDAETASGEIGLVRFEGRLVVELHPEGAGHKGAAVERLLDELRPVAAIALGDDRSDAEAFRAIGAARAAGRLRDGLTVGVHGAAETPPEVIDAADVILAGPRDAARVLALLSREVSTRLA
jgi:trehalose 6-phosphate phosphatase